MAEITVPLDRRARLPRVCIVCGERDCEFERITIRPSVGARGLVALADREGYSTVTLTLPLCDQHRSHFSLQTVLRYLFIGAIILVCLIGLVLLAAVNKGWIILVMMVAVLALAAAWFITSMNINKSRVHIADYTGDEVVLTNVSSKFARAYQEGAGADAEDDEDDERPRRSSESRKPRRRKRDDDDEDD
jgi:hypothetical protein